MQLLAEIQSRVRDAVVTGGFGSLGLSLSGGQVVEHRLAIHRRHYQASLITALLEKFPATTWLVGSPFNTEAARSFVEKYPPSTPCIAEYGEAFPLFLGACQGANRAPYLQAFAELERHIGLVAIAVDVPPLTVQELSTVTRDVLPDTALAIQAGVRYLQASWPVDELMNIYLAEARPEGFEFEPADVCLEIIGARGAFRIGRLVKSDFIFRKSIFEGHTIGDAAEKALEVDSNFDPGRALVAFVANGLVAAIVQATKESQ